MITLRRSLLAVAAAALALALGTTAPASAATCAAQASWPATDATVASRVVDLVNAHRRALGLRTLVVSPTLTAAAAYKARHMAQNRYMEHDDVVAPVQSWSDRIHACGYPQTAGIGENIAMGQRTADEVMTAWLNSPGHRENIERPGYVAIGVGGARTASGTWYWAQEFGTVADAGSVAPGTPSSGGAGAGSTGPGAATGSAGSGSGSAGSGSGSGTATANGSAPARSGSQARRSGRHRLVRHLRVTERRQVRLTLTRRATVRVSVRRVRCHTRRCDRERVVRLRAGRHRVALPGRRHMRPGTYRVRVAAVSAGGTRDRAALRVAVRRTS